MTLGRVVRDSFIAGLAVVAPLLVTTGIANEEDELDALRGDASPKQER